VQVIHSPIRSRPSGGLLSLLCPSGPVPDPSRSVKGHEDQFPLPRLRVRYVLAEAIFDETRVNG